MKKRPLQKMIMIKSHLDFSLSRAFQWKTSRIGQICLLWLTYSSWHVGVTCMVVHKQSSQPAKLNTNLSFTSWLSGMPIELWCRDRIYEGSLLKQCRIITNSHTSFVITSLATGGSVFGSVGFSVCLFVHNISQKGIDGFGWNFMEGPKVVQ